MCLVGQCETVLEGLESMKGINYIPKELKRNLCLAVEANLKRLAKATRKRRHIFNVPTHTLAYYFSYAFSMVFPPRDGSTTLSLSLGEVYSSVASDNLNREIDVSCHFMVPGSQAKQKISHPPIIPTAQLPFAKKGEISSKHSMHNHNKRKKICCMDVNKKILYIVWMQYGKPKSKSIISVIYDLKLCN